MCILVLIVAVFVSLGQAQECPQVDLISNFDLTNYAQGVWYEIARYRNVWEKNGNCVVTNYTKRGDNDFVIELSEVEDNKRIVYDGLINLSTDDHLKGIVNYMFSDGKLTVNTIMTFLLVDYSSYVIKYSCSYDDKTKKTIDAAWILSRTKQLSSDAKAAIDKYISSSKILDKSKFFWDSFTDDSCKFTSSDINRALPKRMTNN